MYCIECELYKASSQSLIFQLYAFFKGVTDYVCSVASHYTNAALPGAEARSKSKAWPAATDQKRLPAAQGSPWRRRARWERAPPHPLLAGCELLGVKGALRPVLTRSCSPPMKRGGLCGLRLPVWPLTPSRAPGWWLAG